MLSAVVALTVWSLPPQAPYVSCRDGYIATTLDQCPVIKHHDPDPPPRGGGGPRGLLGLGGLGGIL